jgi:hypothetical protein
MYKNMISNNIDKYNSKTNSENTESTAKSNEIDELANNDTIKININQNKL